MRDLAALEKSSTPDLHRAIKRGKIRRSLAGHRLERGRLVLEGLYDEYRRLVEMAEEAGELLQRLWAPAFAGGLRSTIAQDTVLACAVQVSESLSFTWPARRISEVARTLTDSSRARRLVLRNWGYATAAACGTPNDEHSEGGTRRRH